MPRKSQAFADSLPARLTSRIQADKFPSISTSRYADTQDMGTLIAKDARQTRPRMRKHLTPARKPAVENQAHRMLSSQAAKRENHVKVQQRVVRAVFTHV